MAQENWQSVERWVQLHDANPNPFPENREQELLTRVRWLLSQSKANDKLAILIELAESTERSGRISLLIEVKALEALAYFLRGDRNQAFDALEQALTRAEPEGFVRVFLDEGEPMRRLLLEWMNASREGGRMTEYVRELLAAFGSVKEIHPSSFVPHPLVEPLSEREMEVLRGLAHGLSYRDIAEQLVVAQGTVKVHVHNIYSKLGVANRTQAIVRARELALL